MSWRRAALYVRAHDLARELSRRLDEGAPLDAELGREARGILTSVSLALTFPRGRVEALRAADRGVVRLRVLARLALELERLSPAAHRSALEELDAVGRMLGGWQRALRSAGKSTGVEAHKAPSA